MKLPRRPLLVVALLLCLFPFAPIQAQTKSQTPVLDITALERSLKMLQIESKLRVLQIHYEHAGFYIPEAWPARLQEEHQNLAAEISRVSSIRAAGLDSWLEQSKKARENEVLQMVQFMQEHLPTLLKGDKWLAERREFELKARELQYKKNLTAQEVSKYITQFTLPIVLNGKDRTDAGIQQQFSERWRKAAEEIYRGAIRDSTNLVASIARYEKERREVEARLVYLKAVEEHMEVLEVIEAAQQPVDTLLEKAEDAAQEKLQGWLDDHYKDVPKELVKETWEKIKAEYESGKELYDKIGELDKDMTLKGNPTAMAAAKRFTILAALYNYTLGKVADSPVMEAFGPLKDFLEYYGAALELIPEVAKKMQALVDKIDQQHKGVRALDIWATVMPDMEPGRLRSLPSMEEFSLQIATDAGIDEESPNARYYMIVEKTVIPRGYATLSREQFLRLQQVIADERFLFAQSESSRGVMDWLTENMFEWRSVNVLSTVVSDAYVEDLKTKSKKTPFTQKEMVDLAYGQPITYKDKTWSAEIFRTKAEEELEKRAEEFSARLGVPLGFSRAKMAQWHAFNVLLIKHAVAFTPKQIVYLFTFYQENEANAAHLEKYIKQLGDERTARAQGVPKAGIPLITQPSSGFVIQPGQTVDLTAHVNVSALAPGRTVPAEVKWSLPPWATGVPPAKANLINGVQQVTYRLTAPKDLKPQVIDTKVTVKLPEAPLENALAGRKKDAARESLPPIAQVRPSVVASLPKTDLPFARPSAPAPAREFHCTEKFEVEASSPVTIKVRRNKDSFPRTAVEITSDVLFDTSTKADWLATLYAAPTPNGPFKEVYMSYITAGAPIVQKDNQGARIGTNTVLLMDWREDKIMKDARQPWYFRATLHQRPGSFDAPDARKNELKSRVEGPGTPEIRVYASDFTDHALGNIISSTNLVWDNTREPFYTHSWGSSGWVSLSVSLSPANQVFDFPGVHFTVKARDWTGHFWSSQMDGTNQLCRHESWTSRNNRALIYVPYRVGDHELPLTITAEAPGISLTRTLTLMLGERANQDRFHDDLVKRHAQRITYAEREEKKNWDDLPRLEKKYEENKAYLEKIRAPGVPMNNALSLFRSASNELVLARLYADKFTRYDKPYTLLTCQKEMAVSQRDWKTALQAELALRPLLQVQFETELQRNVAAEAGYDAEGRQRMAKFFDDERKRLTNDLTTYTTEHLERVVTFAFLAGDAAIVRETVPVVSARKLPTLTNAGAISQHADWLKNSGAIVAMLTGSRADAAQMFLWGYKLKQEKVPNYSQTEMRNGVLPIWWPAEPFKEVPMPQPQPEPVIARAPASRPTVNPVTPGQTSRPSPPVTPVPRTNSVTPPATVTATTTNAPSTTQPPPTATQNNPIVQKASALAQQQRWPEAEDAYREALQQNANDSTLNYSLGLVLAAQNKWKEAEAAHRKSISLSATNAVVHYSLAIALGYQNRWAEMIGPLGEAARLEPGVAEYHFRLSTTLHGQQRFAEAEAAGKRALQLAPANAACQAYVSSSLLAQGKAAEAEPFAREAVRLEPNNGYTQSGLAGVLSAQNKWVEAEAPFRQAIQYLPNDPAPREGLGHSFMAQSQWVNAETMYRQALQLNQNEARFHAHLAAALARQQRMNEAVPAARQAMALGERNHWILKELGLVR